MVASLLDSERHLHALVSARDFVQGTATQKAERTKVRETITNADFVDNLNKSLVILRPIDRLIVKYQSDKVPISDVMPDFHHLPNEFFQAVRRARHHC
jgi:soluble cytochrome b562